MDKILAQEWASRSTSRLEQILAGARESSGRDDTFRVAWGFADPEHQERVERNGSQTVHGLLDWGYTDFDVILGEHPREPLVVAYVWLPFDVPLRFPKSRSKAIRLLKKLDGNSLVWGDEPDLVVGLNTTFIVDVATAESMGTSLMHLELSHGFISHEFGLFAPEPE